MTPEELVRLRALARGGGGARPLRRSRRLRPHHRGPRRRPAPASRGARSPRAAIRSSAPSAAARETPRKLVVLVRRLRLDGEVRAAAAPLPPRGGRVGPRGRGLRLRDAADAPHARAARRAIPRRRSPPPPTGSSTGRPGRGSATRSRPTTTSGAGARSRAARSSSSSRTAGTAATRRSSAREMARLSRGRLRRRLGEPAQGPPGLPAARRRHAGCPPVRRPLPPRPQPGEPRGARRRAGRDRAAARGLTC